jgi:hypothetical protein
MPVERSAIASEEKTPGKYHKVQLQTLCVCLWVLWQELGVVKTNLPVLRPRRGLILTGQLH